MHSASPLLSLLPSSFSTWNSPLHLILLVFPLQNFQVFYFSTWLNQHHYTLNYPYKTMWIFFRVDFQKKNERIGHFTNNTKWGESIGQKWETVLDGLFWGKKLLKFVWGICTHTSKLMHEEKEDIATLHFVLFNEMWSTLSVHIDLRFEFLQPYRFIDIFSHFFARWVIWE